MRNKKLKKRLSTASLVSVSIEEEEEPCEAHSVLNCVYCNLEATTKTAYNYNKMLKRSISYNAIAGSKALKTKASLDSLHHPLTRSYSQTSICSASTSKTIMPISDDSFNEFLKSLFKKDDYNEMREKWDCFPPEVKKVFIAKTIVKRKPEFLDPQFDVQHKWLQKNSPSVNEAFQYMASPSMSSPISTPTNNCFMHYKEKMGPRYKDIFPGADGAKISKAVALSYNELPGSVKDEMKLAAKQNYTDEIKRRFSSVSEFASIYSNPLGPDFDGVISEKINLDDLAEMISKKVQMKLESEEQKTTPVKIDQTVVPAGEMQQLKAHKNPVVVTKNTGFGKLFKAFNKIKAHKRKKKPAALDLYRTPSKNNDSDSVNKLKNRFFHNDKNLIKRNPHEARKN